MLATISIEREIMATVGTGKKSYARAADKIEGIGETLDKIQGRDLLLVNFGVTERPMRGEDKPFVSLTLAEIETPDEIASYHAWSDSLAEKLSQLDKDDLPMIVKFVKVQTAGGFKVWSIE
jgi:hypothetical protein